MAYSYVRYTGNGSTTNYTFSFPYISQDHIKVRLNGVLTTAFTYLTSSSIQFTTAPASGVVIEIRRETPKDSPIVNFTDGSVLLERDLDLLATYDLYLAQENADLLSDSITLNSLGAWDVQSKRLVNVADPVNAQDAVTKNYHDSTFIPQMNTLVTNATTQATAAASSANAAAGSASTASTHATTASTKATEAAASATAAATSATNSASSASAASTSATAAATSATNAANSASSITGSVTAAQTAATNASNSATAAAGSASSASSSASAASTSATNAATSATTASSQASSAATSASQASTYASNASGSATAAASSAAAAAAVVATGMYSSVQDKTGSYTVVSGDAGDLLRVSTGGGAATITLPAISTVGDGFKVSIVKWSGDSNAVTVSRSGSDLINGSSTYVVDTQYKSATFVADGETGTWFAAGTGGSGTNIVVDTFSGNGTNSAFTLSGDPGSKNNTQVVVGGVFQLKSTYTLSGTTLTFTSAPPSGTNNIEVIWSQPLPIGTPSDGTITDAKLAPGFSFATNTQITNLQSQINAIPNPVAMALVFGS